MAGGGGRGGLLRMAETIGAKCISPVITQTPSLQSSWRGERGLQCCACVLCDTRDACLELRQAVELWCCWRTLCNDLCLDQGIWPYPWMEWPHWVASCASSEHCAQLPRWLTGKQTDFETKTALAFVSRAELTDLPHAGCQRSVQVADLRLQTNRHLMCPAILSSPQQILMFRATPNMRRCLSARASNPGALAR
jgi:hypothetical protein